MAANNFQTKGNQKDNKIINICKTHKRKIETLVYLLTVNKWHITHECASNCSIESALIHSTNLVIAQKFDDYFSETLISEKL